MASQRVEIDTSRPFGSVKEAVAIFGERFLAGGGIYTHKPAGSSSITRELGAPPQHIVVSPSSTPSSTAASFSSFPQIIQEGEQAALVNTVRRLETELGETRRELMLLKERETEMEEAVASLNAKLQTGVPKTEVPASAETAATTKANKTTLAAEVSSSRWTSMPGRYSSASLAELLSLGELDEGLPSGRRGTLRKEKPIIPLVTDVLPRKKMKGAGTTPSLVTGRGWRYPWVDPCSVKNKRSAEE